MMIAPQQVIGTSNSPHLEHPLARMMNADDGLDLQARRYTLGKKDTQSP